MSSKATRAVCRTPFTGPIPGPGCPYAPGSGGQCPPWVCWCRADLALAAIDAVTICNRRQRPRWASLAMAVPQWVPIEPMSVLERRTYVFGGRMSMLWQREVVPASSLVKFM